MFEFLLVVLLVLGAAVFISNQRQKRQIEARRVAPPRRCAQTRRRGRHRVRRGVAEPPHRHPDHRTRHRDAAGLPTRARTAMRRPRRASRRTEPDHIKAVTTALEDGRYAMACVLARENGEPLPIRRPPCFFNPQHGPSVLDVDWAPAGGERAIRSGLSAPTPTGSAKAQSRISGPSTTATRAFPTGAVGRAISPTPWATSAPTPR